MKSIIRELWQDKINPSVEVNTLTEEIKELYAKIEIVEENKTSKTKSKSNSQAKLSPEGERKRITKFEHILCPKCGKGHILKGRMAFGCSEYKNGCDLKLSFEQYPQTITPSKLNKLIKINNE